MRTLQGHGFVTIDMQFLADIEAICDNCQGRRFRSDVLEVRYRDRSVDEILNMTAEEAFVFFNGHHRIQRSLNGLRQAGLGYLTLGQPLSTLSGGETQRLRIAALLAGVTDSAASEKKPNKSGQHNETGTLFILDEPSNGTARSRLGSADAMPATTHPGRPLRRDDRTRPSTYRTMRLPNPNGSRSWQAGRNDYEVRRVNLRSRVTVYAGVTVDTVVAR